MKQTRILLSSDVHPYVSSVIHYYWIQLDELFQTFQKLNQMDQYLTNGIHSIPGSPIHPLGVVNCVYYVKSQGLTIYVMRDCHGHMPGFTLWNDILNKKRLTGWPYEDMLYNLSRIYDAVCKTENLCTTLVSKPSGHDSAEAARTVRMLQSWSLIQ